MNAFLQIIKTRLERIKTLYKQFTAKEATPVATKPTESIVEPPNGSMDPTSVLGMPGAAKYGPYPDPTINPNRLALNHPKYKQGDGWKIMLVQYALQDGWKWDKYLTDKGLIWDLEVPPDHPSIGFRIPDKQK